MRTSTGSKIAFLIGLIVLLVAAALWSLSAGEVPVRLQDLPDILRNPDSMDYAVLFHLRLPRLLLALAVGGSLSLSGLILQGVYRNPLVEPYTMGIAGGASLGVALSIVTGAAAALGNFILPLAGFAGAFLTIFLVFVSASGRAGSHVNRMLLTGVMISFVCSSFLLFLLSISTTENLHSIVFWTMGSLEEPNESLINGVGLISLIVLLLSHLFAPALNALRLGREEAAHLGISVAATVRILFLLASVLTGLCVSVAGIIGFVGLVVPHLLRRVFGSDFRWLLSASFLGGGLFLMVCDVLARTLIAPNELPVGVLTGICGGVLFILLLRKKGKEASL